MHDVADDDDDVSNVSGEESVCGSKDVDSQHENDVEFDDIDEIAPFLAADDVNGDDVSQAESLCYTVHVNSRCLDVGTQRACNFEFRDADVDETTPCLAADKDCHFLSDVQFTQPADLSKVFADSSRHSILLYLTQSQNQQDTKHSTESRSVKEFFFK